MDPWVVNMNVCNYNLNITILGLLPSRKIDIESVVVGEKYDIKGFNIRGGLGYVVGIERKIGGKNFKYMTTIICRKSLFADKTCYWSRFVHKNRIIKIGFVWC